MRRGLTDQRKRLHKNTHHWTRQRYRTLVSRRLEGHVRSGERNRLAQYGKEFIYGTYATAQPAPLVVPGSYFS